VASGGSAFIFRIEGRSEEEDAKLAGLFDRGEEYAALIASAEALFVKIGEQSESELRRAVRQLRRDAASVATIDYFPNRRRDRLDSLLQQLDAAVIRRFSTDEPHPVHASIEPRERSDFQRRRWTTRRGLWVDRVASAWLIRRFIDAEPTFAWFDAAKQPPENAIGFDFDGAEFSHVDDLTTFEVLVAVFGLGSDEALMRIGGVVHYLDVGGSPVPEGAGFEAILAGMRDSCADDDELLARMTSVLDALYDSFRNPTSESR